MEEQNTNQVTLKSSQDQEHGLTKVLFGKIVLNHEISSINFYSSWFQLTVLAFMLSSIDLLQTILLTDKFAIPEHEIGTLISEIQFIDYGVRLSVALLFGHIVDKFGRKIVYFYSILTTAIGYILIPFQDTIFPNYLICKLIASQGIIALQMLPLTADYIHDTTKGFASAANYTQSFLGALLSSGTLWILSHVKASVLAIYWTYGFFILAVGLFLGLGVKGGTEYYKRQSQYQTVQGESTWKDVFRSFRRIPWLRIILIISVLGNADLYVMSTGVPLFVKSMMSDENAANLQISIYLVIFFLCAFFFLIYYSCIIDKTPHFKLLIPQMLIATLGFYLIPFINSPGSFLLYIFMAFEGATLPGVFCFGTYLTALYSPAKQRGKIGSIGTGLGLLGAFAMFGIGGYLIDHWTVSAPLLMYCGMITVSFVFVLATATCMKKHGSPHKSKKRLVEDGGMSLQPEAERKTSIDALNENDEVETNADTQA